MFTSSLILFLRIIRFTLNCLFLFLFLLFLFLGLLVFLLLFGRLIVGFCLLGWGLGYLLGLDQVFLYDDLVDYLWGLLLGWLVFGLDLLYDLLDLYLLDFLDFDFYQWLFGFIGLLLFLLLLISLRFDSMNLTVQRIKTKPKPIPIPIRLSPPIILDNNMLLQHILIPILTRFLSHLIKYRRLFAIIISINVKFDELKFLDFVVTVLGVVCGG